MSKPLGSGRSDEQPQRVNKIAVIQQRSRFMLENSGQYGLSLPSITLYFEGEATDTAIALYRPT